MTLQVMNVATQKMAGVILGFDEADALTYRMFTGTGEWVGQVAQFEAFGDVTGGTVMPAPADGSALPKGARRVYRPARTYIPMSKQEVDAAVAASTRIFQPSAMAGNRTPLLVATLRGAPLYRSQGFDSYERIYQHQVARLPAMGEHHPLEGQVRELDPAAAPQLETLAQAATGLDRSALLQELLPQAERIVGLELEGQLRGFALLRP